MTIIMVQVISEEYGIKKQAELLELIKSEPRLYHVGFRQFSDGTSGLMFCLAHENVILDE